MNYQNALQTDRARFRNVIAAHRFRRPFALASIILVLAAYVEGRVGLDLLMRPLGDGARTHPATAICVVALCMGLISFRSHQPTPLWRYIMSSTILSLLCVTLGARLAVWLTGDAGLADPVLRAMDGMGTDTVLILALFFASAIVRRHFGRIGLTIAVLGTLVLISDFIGMSFGQRMFEGQMAASTVAALFPANLALLTLYAHRPFARVLLVTGPVGFRTRVMLIVGLMVPWLGGVVLHRVFGVPDRLVPVEAVIVGAIMLSMGMLAIVSGYFHERMDRDRRALERQLARMATLDPLTGAQNRYGMMSALDHSWRDFVERDRGAGVILLDLDHFKVLNDTCGHDAGDAVLRGLVEQVLPALRGGDVIGRWGGEEFLILSEAQSLDDLAQLAERLRKKIKAIGPQTCSEGQKRVPVSASLGVAIFQADDSGHAAVIKRADNALYEAKAQGRNRVVTAGRVTGAAA